MTKTKVFQVKQVAAMTGVTVRTLHHYDEIGLLTPSDRTAAGYRLYDQDDLLRLQQILINRALGLPLAEIRRLLDDPDFDLAGSLTRQRTLLQSRVADAQRMIASIDTTLSNLSEDSKMTIDFAALFDGFDPEQHASEAEDRWGETKAYRQSAKKTAQYSEAEWAEMKAEQDAIWQEAAMAMNSGASPDGPEARALVNRHRAHITRWFYDLTPEVHCGLADMWEHDPRFQETIDAHGTGLTAWFAYAVRAASKP